MTDLIPTYLRILGPLPFLAVCLSGLLVLLCLVAHSLPTRRILRRIIVGLFLIDLLLLLVSGSAYFSLTSKFEGDLVELNVERMQGLSFQLIMLAVTSASVVSVLLRQRGRP